MGQLPRSKVTFNFQGRERKSHLDPWTLSMSAVPWCAFCFERRNQLGIKWHIDNEGGNKKPLVTASIGAHLKQLITGSRSKGWVPPLHPSTPFISALAPIINYYYQWIKQQDTKNKSLAQVSMTQWLIMPLWVPPISNESLVVSFSRAFNLSSSESPCVLCVPMDPWIHVTLLLSSIVMCECLIALCQAACN